MNIQPSLAPALVERAPARRRPEPFKCLRLSALAAPTLALLAACGGGGGGSGDAGAGADGTVPLLALTDANSKAAAYNALINISNPGPQGGATAVVTGTNPTSKSASASTLEPPSHVALSLVRLAVSGWRGGSTKVAVNEAVDCEGGGSVRAEGEMAAPPNLSTGDRVTLIATNCKPSPNSQETVSGRVAVTVQALGTDVNDVSLEYEAFSLRGAEFSVTLSGDSRLRTSGASTTQLTGTRLALSTTLGTQTTLLRWLDYRLAAEPVNGVVGGSLSARVETLDSRLGTEWVGYTLSTPSPATRELRSGAVRLQGQGSAMLVQFEDDGNATLQLDADGNGSYERSTTYTRQQLATP